MASVCKGDRGARRPPATIGAAVSEHLHTCTHSKTGRSVARHWQEQTLEVALAFARLPEARADRRRRQSLMEGSFAQAANQFHFKRARWRRRWRHQIQDWLIAAVQNIARLTSCA